MIAPIRPNAKFAIGQLVRHRRYGYRGLIVGMDDHCRAQENWYKSNRTQPERNQPWYHVLVHENPTVTYAAETSLLPDETLEPINHPLVDLYFAEFNGESYERNDRPFEGW